MTACNSNLTAERLRELLHYNQETGIFTRLLGKGGDAKGSVAGCKRPDGRVTIAVDDVGYKAHRLAWLYVYGQWPTNVIDHINHDPSDNRIANLRDVSKSVNQHNRKGPASHNKSGYLGVWFDKRRGKWYAEIRSQNRKIFVGSFVNIEDAVAARKEAELRFHPDNP